ncbi:MAG: CBS domain-containing protein [Deltaproteobacteria bacterium]|nr:CBS domain-containing protein [Deltaproteobacteria bacterium]
MAEYKKVKEIMAPIEDYDRVNIGAQLCDAMSILKRNYEKLKVGEQGNFHKTLLVVDDKDNVVGKLSMYDLIRGLVPEAAKKPEVSKAYNAMRSGRVQDVVEEIGDFQEHFKWLSSSFSDLIKQEAHKNVRDIMTPIEKSSLKAEDKITHGIYTLFKDKVRQQFVQSEGKIVGVVNLNVIFNQLLEVASPECHIHW